jgi:hypothetical protein
MRADADSVPITVYEDEPSSLIAYALASTGYLNFLTSREAAAAKVDLIVRCSLWIELFCKLIRCVYSARPKQQKEHHPAT